jgi:CHASE3 domain sensor protein
MGTQQAVLRATNRPFAFMVGLVFALVLALAGWYAIASYVPAQHSAANAPTSNTPQYVKVDTEQRRGER